MPDNPPTEDVARPGTGLLERVIREQYVIKRHSDREIAEALGVDRVTVTKWRHRWGIHRADRPEVAL